VSSPYDTYSSPLASRNASPEMLRLWSPRHKFNTWRRIWLAVAEAQLRMQSSYAGKASISLPVTAEQVKDLREVVNRPGGITNEEMAAAERYERELRHDVMAHVHALGDSCPKARGILHLGCTSQDVVCNADFAVLMESLSLTSVKVTRAISALAKFAEEHIRTPTLAFTHYQAAQPLTIGRRAAQWASELSMALHRLAWSQRAVLPRGFKGATGTQAAFHALFSGDHVAVELFDDDATGRVVGPLSERGVLPTDRAMNYDFSLALTSQTYPRVIDTFILADLASCAAVLHKIATDIRLLSNRKELDEPFEDKQIGSSAMPYKRNPMRCERICGLTRFVMNLVGNAYDTAATQWLERTLDDSSNRRLSLPEAFLALDGALDLMHNVASGLIVHEAMVRKNLMAELPFMATENILMACVKLGGDRQEYHEKIRVHAQAAGMRVKQEGLDNDLLERLRNDKAFWGTARGGALSAELDWEGLMDPMKYVGRSVEQTERFIKEVVEPLRAQYGEAIAKLGESGPRV
jgi:adenylosuccinate lyase